MYDMLLVGSLGVRLRYGCNGMFVGCHRYLVVLFVQVFVVIVLQTGSVLHGVELIPFLICTSTPWSTFDPVSHKRP